MRIIFLDRDGVINRFPGRGQYVTKPVEFVFLPGSIQAVKRFNGHGFKVYVVSNQAGVGKGLYAERDLQAINKKMLTGLSREKASIDGILYCTHSPSEGCACRKPKTGMIDEIISGLSRGPKESFFIGDSMVDIETAKNANINSVLVLSGRTKLSEQSDWPIKPDYVFDNLLIASYYLCNHYGQ